MSVICEFMIRRVYVVRVNAIVRRLGKDDRRECWENKIEGKMVG